nr:GSTo3 [Pagiophloeus tsushimanus]
MSVIRKLLSKLGKRAAMSDKHLSSGSVEPPRVDGLLRVYSMKLCPFAQRARLVVKAKNLPHDIVNIDLQNKPDWYFKIHPKGQVPSLLDEGKITIESLDIADYLDEKYPTDSPLYPLDPEAKRKDQEVIRNLIGPAIQPIGKIQYSGESYTPEQALEILLPNAQPLEDELVKRGTPFFGGDKPGMIDYMLWPWAERSATIAYSVGVEKLPLKDDQIPTLRKWAKTMLKVPTVKELYTPSDIFIKAAQARKSNTFNYATFFNE